MTTAKGANLPRTIAELDVWHAQTREEILEPDLPIIDAHHHMWDRPPQRYQLDELMAETNAGHRIVATVFVEANAMYRPYGPEEMRPVGETEYVNGVAAASASGIYGPTRLCAGIVSYADLRLGSRVRPVLEAHIRAGGDRFRGIRQQVQFDDTLGSMAKKPTTKGMLMDPAFRAGFAELAPLGLTFDAFVYFHQLAEVADIAKAFPETGIILNHVGGPLGIGPYADKRVEVYQEWSAAIRELAACPNVTVKVGGLGMTTYGFGFEHLGVPPLSETLANTWRPYVETCIDAFGPDRCMFESNFPVDKQSCSYVTLWNAFKRLTAGASADEKKALFSGTAARVYRLAI